MASTDTIHEYITDPLDVLVQPTVLPGNSLHATSLTCHYDQFVFIVFNRFSQNNPDIWNITIDDVTITELWWDPDDVNFTLECLEQFDIPFDDIVLGARDRNRVPDLVFQRVISRLMLSVTHRLDFSRVPLSQTRIRYMIKNKPPTLELVFADRRVAATTGQF